MATQTADINLNRGLKWSGIGHGVLLVAIVIKSLVFPSTTHPYIPSLRVDLVGLPDQLKKDLDRMKTLPRPQAGKETPERDMESAQEPDENELVLNPKKKNGKESKAEKKIKAREKLALERIQALNRISESEEETSADSAVVKGNIVSKGSALSGDAKESTAEQYYDTVLDRLQDNWSLPVWLSRQSLSAQVQVYIDPHGLVRSLTFIKSSGNQQFDDAVRRAVTASAPFPSPPADIRTSLLTRGILFGFPL